jgi:hypothetical protein
MATELEARRKGLQGNRESKKHRKEEKGRTAAKMWTKHDVYDGLKTRVADPDWIRIQSGQWIRIRIQEGKYDPQK